MTLEQFLSTLRARWWVVLLILVVTVATAVALSLILPKQYLATASVVVDSKPDPVSAVLYSGAPSPAFMATQVDILESERVALRVVKNLKLADSPQIRAQWQEATKGEGSIESWLIGAFQRSMDVKPSKESNVITVAYRAPDPRFAAALANAFVQAYIDTTLDLRVDPARQYSTFFDRRTKEARDALERAQAKLSAYERDKGIVVSDERLDVENSRLNELSSQLVMLQALSSESGSRQLQANGASADKLQEVLSNPVIAGLKSDLSRAETRLQELNSKLGANHPQVIEAKASIAELRTRMDAETRRVSGGVGVTNTINKQREAEIKASVEAQRAKVLRMKLARDEGLLFVRDVENAQRAYEAIQARFNQSSLESQTTQSNVYVLTQATPPLLAASPKIVVNTVLSIIIGGILGTAVVLLMEAADRRVRSVTQASLSLGLPILGVMVSPSATKSIRGRRLSLIQGSTLGGLPAPGGVNNG